MAKKKNWIDGLPDGVVYPCLDDPNYGREIPGRGKVIGCIKGDGYWVGGNQVNREDLDVIVSETALVPVPYPETVEAELIDENLSSREVLSVLSKEITKNEGKKKKKEFSKYQLEFFEEAVHGNRNIILKAYAGSGKTTSLVEMMNRLPKNKKILALAYNATIGAKLRALAPSHVKVKTFHGFGLEQLRKSLEKINGKEIEDINDFGEVDAEYSGFYIDAKESYLSLAIRDFVDSYFNADYKRIKDPMASFLFEFVKACKNLAVNEEASDFESQMTPILSHPFFEDFSRLIEEYEKLLKAPFMDFLKIAVSKMLKVSRNGKKTFVKKVNGKEQVLSGIAFSYDDMIYLTAVSNKIEVETFDYVIIDELQDMNTSQILMSLRAAAKKGSKIIAAGDENQAIYAFRFADSMIMKKLEIVTEAKVMKLPISYRLPNSIRDMARDCVKDIETPEWAIQGEIHYVGEEEACELFMPGDMVLSRSNNELSRIAMKALSFKKTIILKGAKGLRYNVQSIILEIIKKTKVSKVEILIKLLEKASDNLREVIMEIDDQINMTTNRNEKYKLQEKDKGFIKELEDINLVKAIAEIALSIGIKEASQIQEITDKLIGEYPVFEAPRKNLSQTELAIELEKFERSKERILSKYVLFSSVHQMKGEEADRVFLMRRTFKGNCIDETDSKGKKISKEENNLYYVAITRARESLFFIS